jgi:hypothetical protein
VIDWQPIETAPIGEPILVTSAFWPGWFDVGGQVLGEWRRGIIAVNVLDLFSGIGGFSLGLERAGMRTVAFCEIDPSARKVLASTGRASRSSMTSAPSTMQEAMPVLSAVASLARTLASKCSWGECAGLPANVRDSGGSYYEPFAWYDRDFAIVENVAALLGRGMGTVLGDLAEIGYDAEWHCVRASDIGAPHERDRVYIVAYPVGSRGPRLVTSADFGAAGPWRLRGQEDLQSARRCSVRARRSLASTPPSPSG